MSLYVSNRLVRWFLKDALILWINPETVHAHIATSRPENHRIKQQFSQLRSKNKLVKVLQHQTLRATNAFESFVIDPGFYQNITKLEQHKKYIKIKNIIDHRDNYKESQWYLDLVSDLTTRGFAKHKKITMVSKNDIDHFIKTYVLSLVDSLEQDGFDLTKGGGIGRALIGEDGSIHKSSSGSHRFYAARVLGISPIPVRVAGAHEDWYRKQIGNGFRPKKLRAALSEVQANHS